MFTKMNIKIVLYSEYEKKLNLFEITIDSREYLARFKLYILTNLSNSEKSG